MNRPAAKFWSKWADDLSICNARRLQVLYQHRENGAKGAKASPQHHLRKNTEETPFRQQRDIDVRLRQPRHTSMSHVA
jgi:hypothetical protein